jgi:urease beta subunit
LTHPHRLKVSDTIYEDAHANTGIAISHVHIIHIANNKYDRSQAKGLRAEATSSTVAIPEIQFLNSTDQAVNIIKYIATFENNIPKKLSFCIVFSLCIIDGILLCAIFASLIS